MLPLKKDTVVGILLVLVALALAAAFPPFLVVAGIALAAWLGYRLIRRPRA